MSLSKITNYIEDDWDDNNLKGRSNSNEGYFLHPSDDLIPDYEAGDALKGVYRPERDQYYSSSSASNNQLELTAGSGVRTPSKMTVGRWRADYSNLNTGNQLHDWTFMGTQIDSSDTRSPSNGYAVHMTDAGSGSLRLRSYGPDAEGNMIYKGFGFSSATLEITRDSYGNLELLRNGSSEGTTTNRDHSSSKMMYIGEDDSEVHIDNLEAR